MAAFMLKQQSSEVVTEGIWPTKPKIYTVWPNTEKICQALHWNKMFFSTFTLYSDECKLVCVSGKHPDHLY